MVVSNVSFARDLPPVDPLGLPPNTLSPGSCTWLDSTLRSGRKLVLPMPTCRKTTMSFSVRPGGSVVCFPASWPPLPVSLPTKLDLNSTLWNSTKEFCERFLWIPNLEPTTTFTASTTKRDTRTNLAVPELSRRNSSKHSKTMPDALNGTMPLCKKPWNVSNPTPSPSLSCWITWIGCQTPWFTKNGWPCNEHLFLEHKSCGDLPLLTWVTSLSSTTWILPI
mmetsp:Transcript_23305/g.55108  ORF Transcript_23305/g.55108 Transcript_23305/m.55108 type:complete len:222 (+) Transcript_23305:584-1249(+)